MSQEDGKRNRNACQIPMLLSTKEQNMGTRQGEGFNHDHMRWHETPQKGQSPLPRRDISDFFLPALFRYLRIRNSDIIRGGLIILKGCASNHVLYWLTRTCCSGLRAQGTFFHSFPPCIKPPSLTLSRGGDRQAEWRLATSRCPWQREVLAIFSPNEGGSEGRSGVRKLRRRIHRVLRVVVSLSPTPRNVNWEGKDQLFLYSLGKIGVDGRPAKMASGI
ncbi:hypothetical protein CEXT_397961 [Caerostris extrusa]|uniref:Uncharacterized protein n=1 Tax=Caerostris extrusa TaxID=172846 RepID=A0AAV4XS13_CAEEX|nr:hypothetical protein CEXT_397961 [Caerostris extrusa]